MEPKNRRPPVRRARKDDYEPAYTFEDLDADRSLEPVEEAEDVDE